MDTSTNLVGTPITVSFVPQSGPKDTPVTVILSEDAVFVTAIKFNGTPVASFTPNGDGTFSTRVPMTATTGKVSVHFSGGGSAVSSQNFTVTGSVSTSPTITGFSPMTGGVGTRITVTGTNLGSINTAMIGSSPASVQSASATSVQIDVLGIGSGQIKLSGETGMATSAQSFTFTQGGGGGGAGAPVISGFSPLSGSVGTPVTITGSGFATLAEVTFNGRAAVTQPGSDTQFIAFVPEGATSGKISVRNAVDTTLSSNNFTVNSQVPLPTITGFSPSTGAFPLEVAISGGNLGNVSQVKFNGMVASFRLGTANQCFATVPPQATTGRIQVTTPFGMATSATDFVVSSATSGRPIIGSFSPMSGPVGTDITVVGQNFAGANISLAGQRITPTSLLDSEIKFKVPAGAASGFITVTNRLGSATTADQFSVTAVAPPPLVATGQMVALPLDVQTLTTQFDNERLPQYTGFPGGLVGLLDLVSGQSFQIPLKATRSDNAFDSVVISVTPIVLTGFTFGTPTPVPAGSPFSFDIATEIGLQDGTYDFGVNGRGQIGEMLEYLPFGLTVNVRAPLEFLLPQSIAVVPGQVSTTRIRVIRRRAPGSALLTADSGRSNLPAGLGLSFAYAGFSNNFVEDGGGVVDNYDLTISAAPTVATGNFDLVIANPAPGYFVKNRTQAIAVQVRPVEVVLERVSVSQAQVRPTETFDITFDLISRGFEGMAQVKVVSITNEDGTAAQINKQGFNPEDFALMPTTQLSGVPFSFFVSQQCTSGTKTIMLELKYMVNGVVKTMDAMATIIVAFDRVVLTPDNLDFSIFDRETRSFGIDIERVNGFGEAFTVSLTYPQGRITVSPDPIQVSSSSIREVVRISGLGIGQTSDEFLQFDPSPLGSVLQLPILIRTTSNFLGFAASGYTLMAGADTTATVKINSTALKPLGQSDDIEISFQVVDGSGADVTSLFSVVPTGPQSINNFSREVAVKLRSIRRVQTSQYRLVATGTFGGSRSGPRFTAEVPLNV